MTEQPTRSRALRRVQGREDWSLLEELNHVHWWLIISMALGPALGVLTFWILGSRAADLGLTSDGVVMAGIFVLAVWYWVSGAIPPFATGIVVIALCAYLLGLPAELGRPFGLTGAGSAVTGWREFVEVAAAPVIILMLGGFTLGAASHKHGLDAMLARGLLTVFRGGPRRLILGVLLITAVLSMWMSNTATAAMMVTLVTPIALRSPEGSAMRRGLLLAVPLGANIGGMGTPIGTPPNAIAFSLLRAEGVEISFLGWMTFALPVAMVLLATAWVFLAFGMGKFGDEAADVESDQESEVESVWTARRIVVALTFVATIVLWVTGRWTGIHMALAAVLPIAVFPAFRILDRHDINTLDWDIVLLMAGGLALGAGMSQTGLAGWIVESLPLQSLAPALSLAVFVVLTTMLATFMSNTAAANLVLPIAIGVAGASAALGVPQIGVAVALAASVGMALPVSTPPNAIAFATGHVRTGEFIRSAVLIDATAFVLIMGVALYALPHLV
ncbi:MAG: DASS family sodium-coupled anion symporter [Planctomycetota bacterium]